jgi:hypothetical protein
VEPRVSLVTLGVLGILSEFAEFEREKIKARTRDGIASRARVVGKPWGEPAYGYERGADGHWTVNAREAAIARRIFTERVEHGRSYNAIGTLLNREGVPTRRGANWAANTVRKLLTSAHVLGRFHHGGQWYEGKHPAIVDADTWTAAQALAEVGAKFAPSSGGRRPSRHLFVGGLLRCAECGEAMLPRSDGDAYLCRTNKMLKGAGSCSMGKLDRATIERAVLALFERSFHDFAETRAHVATDLAAQLEEASAQLDEAKRESAEKAAQRARVERDYLSGELSAASHDRLSARLDEEQAGAKAQRDRLAANVKAIRETLDSTDSEHEALARLSELRQAIDKRVRSAEEQGDVRALRAALSQLFVAVYVTPDGQVALEPRESNIDPLADPLPHYVPLRAAIPFATRKTSVHGSGVPL